MKKSFNLSELQDDPVALTALMNFIKKPEVEEKPVESNKVKKKKLKTKAKVKIKEPRKDTSHIVVLEAEEKPKPKTSEEVKVAYDDDDTHSRIRALDILISNIESYYNQTSPVYVSMQTLFASAYRYTVTLKMRTLIAASRDLCKEAIANIEKKSKTSLQMKAKGQANAVIREKVKKFSNREIAEKLGKNIEELKTYLAHEMKKQAGKAYDNIHEGYVVDLSKYENSVESIVLARADLMMTLAQPLDLLNANDGKTAEFTRIEGPIYSLRNALVVGFRPGALPKKIIEETLEIAVAQTFGLKGVPVAKQLRHKSSNRIWFYLPETSAVIKTVMFADKSLNSEFDMFKSMSNDPTEDDIRFIFLRAGVDEASINEVIKRWKRSDSKRGRLAIITNAFVETKRRLKNARLRKQREAFLEENAEILKDTRLSEDRRAKILEIREQHQNTFSTLASHTGRPDQGLRLSQIEHLNRAFDQIEAVAVRGNSSSDSRIGIRQNIHRDKMKCREIYHDFKSLTYESKMLHQKVATNTMVLEINRKNAFHTISGIEEDLDA